MEKFYTNFYYPALNTYINEGNYSKSNLYLP